jgi:hypothetical protein
MDYPHPWITLDKNGVPNISQSYATNIGIWDKVAIDYGYREFDTAGKPKEDPTALNAILTASEKTGLIYITDEDARPLGGAHPHGHLWDNGTDPADELDRILTIRAAALKRFGEDAIKTGTPMAQLEDTLVPLYLLERYQTEAAAKEIGGLDYRYNLRGDGQINPTIVPPDVQRKALTAVLKTLSPDTLTLPESLLQTLPPRPPGLERTRESFASNTGLTFDPIAAAESSADLTLALLFNAQRASRLIEYHARNVDNPSLNEIIDNTLAAVTTKPHHAGERLPLDGIIERTVYIRTIEALLSLASNPQASAIARAVTNARLATIKQQADLADPLGLYISQRITQFQTDPTRFTPATPIAVPPGMPIGDDEETD